MPWSCRSWNANRIEPLDTGAGVAVGAGAAVAVGAVVGRAVAVGAAVVAPVVGALVGDAAVGAAVGAAGFGVAVALPPPQALRTTAVTEIAAAQGRIFRVA